MSESIISNEKVCFYCGTPLDLHKHHIYGAGKRNISEREGCWIYLCMHHHDDGSKESIHNNPQFEKTMRQFCQYIWEQKRGSRDEFRKLFEKSYL